MTECCTYYHVLRKVASDFSIWYFCHTATLTMYVKTLTPNLNVDKNLFRGGIGPQVAFLAMGLFVFLLQTTEISIMFLALFACDEIRFE